MITNIYEWSSWFFYSLFAFALFRFICSRDFSWTSLQWISLPLPTFFVRLRHCSYWVHKVPAWSGKLFQWWSGDSWWCFRQFWEQSCLTKWRPQRDRTVRPVVCILVWWESKWKGWQELLTTVKAEWGLALSRKSIGAVCTTRGWSEGRWRGQSGRLQGRCSLEEVPNGV